MAKAEREGITVEQMDGSAFQPIADQWLDDFYAIYTHTAERAGFVARARTYYQRVWDLFAAAGHVRSPSPRAMASGWPRSSTTVGDQRRRRSAA